MKVEVEEEEQGITPLKPWRTENSKTGTKETLSLSLFSSKSETEPRHRRYLLVVLSLS